MLNEVAFCNGDALICMPSCNIIDSKVFSFLIGSKMRVFCFGAAVSSKSFFVSSLPSSFNIAFFSTILSIILPCASLSVAETKKSGSLAFCKSFFSLSNHSTYSLAHDPHARIGIFHQTCTFLFLAYTMLKQFANGSLIKIRSCFQFHFPMCKRTVRVRAFPTHISTAQLGLAQVGCLSQFIL
jgi:hypothetical protein